MAWIDDKIFRFKGNDLLVMLYLVTHMNEDGVCSFGVRTMAAEVGISYQAARESIKRLCKQGETTQFTTQFTTHVLTSITICNYDSYTKKIKVEQRSLQRSLQRTQTHPKKTLEERKIEFGLTLKSFTQDFGGEYPRAMINDFYRYWSEPNQTQTKMRWEMEKTWSVAGRLATWAKNNERRFNNTTYQNRDEQRAYDVQRRQEGAAAIIARLAAEENDDMQ